MTEEYKYKPPEYITKQAHKDLYDTGQLGCLFCHTYYDRHSLSYYEVQMSKQTDEYTEYRCTSCGYTMRFDNNVTTSIRKEDT